jgi:hypothetical protein
MVRSTEVTMFAFLSMRRDAFASGIEGCHGELGCDSCRFVRLTRGLLGAVRRRRKSRTGGLPSCRSNRQGLIVALQICRSHAQVWSLLERNVPGPIGNLKLGGAQVVLISLSIQQAFCGHGTFTRRSDDRVQPCILALVWILKVSCHEF